MEFHLMGRLLVSGAIKNTLAYYGKELLQAVIYNRKKHLLQTQVHLLGKVLDVYSQNYLSMIFSYVSLK
jgi:hypothetical protein